MHIQDIKRWHWIIIAVVVGLAVSYLWSNLDSSKSWPSLSPNDFESGVLTEPLQEYALENIEVMPPTEDGKYQVVAYQLRDKGVPGQLDVEGPKAIMTDVPFRAGRWRGVEEQYPNVIEFLKAMQKHNPNLKFKYAWYRETWAIYLLWTGASLLLIGGVLPSVISLMVGAGLGFHKKEEGPEYDLSRFKGEAEKKDAKPQPTSADMQQLHQLEDELERKLAAQRMGVPLPEDEQEGGAVRKLDGGPLEAAAAAGPQEEHEYRGEFYPVDRGVKKKGE